MKNKDKIDGPCKELVARIILSMDPKEIKRKVLLDISDELSIPNEGEYNKNLSSLLEGDNSGEQIANYFWHDNQGYLLSIGELKRTIPEIVPLYAFKHNVIYALTNLYYANIIFDNMLKMPKLRYIITDDSGQIMKTNTPLRSFDLEVLK